MVFDSPLSVTTDSDAPPSSVGCYSQVRLKHEGDILVLVLPSEANAIAELPWSEIWQELKHRLRGQEKSWKPGAKVALLARDRLLDSRELQTIAETLQEVKLSLESIRTNRRQTAVAAATAGYSVEQIASTNNLFEATGSDNSESLVEPLYLQSTVRSGIEVRHPGTIVICGDLNPGGTVISAGDIFVWGRLRGVAHAGSQGNNQARIMALQMEFTQLRIADSVARSPLSLPKKFDPEVAFVTKKGIHLHRANNFAKKYIFSSEQDMWVENREKNNRSY